MFNDDNLEVLSEPDEIYRSLRALQLLRSVLTIRFDFSQETYSSIILHIDLEDKEFIIDALTPMTGDQLLQEGNHFSLTGMYDGTHIQCRGHRIDSKKFPEFDNAYSIAFPTSIQRQQRRHNYRSDLSEEITSQITLHSDKRKELPPGKITNISTSGVGCEFVGYVRPELSNGEYCESAVININEEISITSALRVKQVLFDKNKHTTRCGFEFIALEKAQSKSLEKYLFTLQRKKRRLSSGKNKRQITL